MTDLIKLIFPPENSSYKVTDGEEVAAIKLAGGASRYRKDILNSTSIVEAEWICNALKLEYLRAFYRSVTVSGSLPFLVDLTIDKAYRTEHTAYFVPNTMSLVKLGPSKYQVTANLEIYPIENDVDYDVVTVMLFNELRIAGIAPWLDSLEHLVNVDLAAVAPE